MKLTATLLATVLLAACGSPDAEKNIASAEQVAMSNAAAHEAPIPSTDANTASPPAAERDKDDEVGDGSLPSIPASFHGEWNSEPSACGTGASETRLRIDADRLRFYESVGAVRTVERVSDRVIEVTAAYQGEGDTWTNERRLALSANGDSLTISGEGATLTRQRCP